MMKGRKKKNGVRIRSDAHQQHAPVRKLPRPEVKIDRSPPKPDTREVILNKIGWLEYQRTQLPKRKSVRTVMYEDSIAKSLQIYYKKLDKLDEEETKKVLANKKLAKGIRKARKEGSPSSPYKPLGETKK